MQPGTILADRFKIELLAGSGGMGQVYRARDLLTLEPVALKLEHRDLSLEHAERFEMEVQLLAELHNPHIVRYITHGTTERGQRYLVMEWLEGEDLATRLFRDRLTITDSLTLALGVAKALDAIHAKGIIHRDLKPSNLFLPKGSIPEIKLLDFGIARLAHLPRVTQTGMILGTLGYMAPEQARGEREIDARADLFSLGCILFECLTGAPAFAGQRAMEVLAKIVFADMPPISTLVPGVPSGLEALLARLLSKTPARRPTSAAQVAAELAVLQGPEGARELRRETEVPPPRSSLTRGEQRLLCVVLVSGLLPLEATVMPTMTRHASKSLRDALQQVAAEHDARLEVLADGSVASALIGMDAATDQAALGARCALALRALLPERRMALAMGRGELDGRLPVGEAIDRAARLLRAAPTARLAENALSLAVDELAAGLLDMRFEVVASDGGHALVGERAEGVRTLLGKATPFVGRERELATLQAILEECHAESVACAVLVTAGVGVGKSRLRYEFLQHLRDDAAQIWMARGDPMRAFAPFELLGQVVRQVARVQTGEPIEAQRQKLMTRVARRMDGAKAARVAAFLGEIVGVPFPDDDSVQLRAARQNAMLMGDQMRQAWVDFVEAECKAQPVLLVLEDLHWGDLPTVEYVAAALRMLHAQPLMVLAFSRPEVHDVFPRLWPEHVQEEMRLAKLPRKACEKLLREVLGEGLTQERIAKLVERSQGNAFYLEELARAVAEGRGEDAPGTVLAMVQSRLECLGPEERRFLRAASIFGQVFWRGGAAALLDQEMPTEALNALVAELEENEWVVPLRETKFQGEREYMFRHAVMREVAYGMLVNEDRVLGHLLAGEWLERVGETDARVVAEHFAQGEKPGRAAGWYHRAAEQALGGNDLGAAIEGAEKGIACGADQKTVGALRLVQAEAHVWRGDFALAEQRGGEALELLEPGSSAWFAAFTQMIFAACRLGGFERVKRWMGTVGETAPLPGAQRARNNCLCAGATTMAVGGQVEGADTLIAAVELAMADALALDNEVLANLHQARTFRAMAAGDLGACLTGLQAALGAFEQAGDRRNACMTRANLGFYHAELGDYAGAEATLRAALVAADRMRLQDVAASARASLGQVLGYLGQVAEAREIEEAAVAALQRLGDPRLEVASRSYLAKIFLFAGDPASAEREARAATEILACTPPLRVAASAIHARALLDLGRTGEALSVAREAFSTLESIGALEEGESLVRLVYAEALVACGDDAAVAAIRSARENLLARASKIQEQTLRERFLHGVPDNARTLELAGRWLGEEPA